MLGKEILEIFSFFELCSSFTNNRKLSVAIVNKSVTWFVLSSKSFLFYKKTSAFSGIIYVASLCSNVDLSWNSQSLLRNTFQLFWWGNPSKSLSLLVSFLRFLSLQYMCGLFAVYFFAFLLIDFILFCLILNMYWLEMWPRFSRCQDSMSFWVLLENERALDFRVAGPTKLT